MPGAGNGNGSSKPFWKVDGQSDWSSGVNSGQVPAISSESLPHGLKRNALAWLGNGTVRGGAITPRNGFLPLVQNINWPGIFQGAYMYEPDGGDPYIMMGVGGETYQVRVDTDNSVVKVSAGPTSRSPTIPQWYFVQGEQFMIVQDGTQTPGVWDGTTLKLITAFTNTLGVPTLPIGLAMDYYMGRIWVAGNGAINFGTREYMAGDIVRGPSGTPGAPYNLRDSILFQSENIYLKTGGAFVVPTSAGSIRAIAHTAELDTSLGQGRLYVFTRNSIYSLNVPVTRVDWAGADNSHLPLQTVSQIKFGAVGDRSVVKVNGDLFYQTLEPGIRSLTLAIRYFQQWGNVGISRNENRVLQLNDRSLLRFSTGIEFNNRLLQSCLPFQTHVGVAHRGYIPLDFDIISTLDEKLPPAWEGMDEGLQFLQLLEGDFGGRQRAFAIVLSEVSNQIEVWELTSTEIRDNGDSRITMWFETPAYTWGDQFQLKKLVSGEMWLDQIFGTVDITIEYRVDASPCWIKWHQFRICAARNCVENPDIECVIYPSQNACEQNRASLDLPVPPDQCDPNNKRPTNIGFQFQLRITIKGTATVRGLLVYAEQREKAPYDSVPCGSGITALNVGSNISTGVS